MNKTKKLLAAVLAVMMLCSVLPMGVMATESEENTFPMKVYVGYLYTRLILEDNKNFMASKYLRPAPFTADENENSFIVRFAEIGEDIASEDILRFVFEQLTGHTLVGWNIYAYTEPEYECKSLLLAYSEDDENDDEAELELLGTVKVGEDYNGFEYDFSSVVDKYDSNEIILEPVLERRVIDPQPQNSNPDSVEDYYTAGVKYYVPPVIDPEKMDMSSLKLTDVIGNGEWADADAEDSIVDVEYQWYKVDQITDKNDAERAKWWVGEYTDGSWKSSFDYDAYYIDLGIDVREGDRVSFNVSGVDDYKVFVEYLGEYDEVEQDYEQSFNWEKISSDSYTAEQDGILYVCFESEEDSFSAEVTLTGKYTAVSGHTGRCLLEGGNGEEDLEEGAYYVCRASIMEDGFEPKADILAPAPPSEIDGEGSGITAGESTKAPYIEVLESNPVEYKKPVPAEKKSVFTDFMKSYFYMKNTFTVSDNHNDGGDIAITYPATGNMRIDVKCAITVEEGYEIADVLVDGVSVGAVEEYLFRGINKDHKIEAVFAPIAE